MKAELCYLTGRLFRSFWQRTANPPTKELIEHALKLFKQNSQEKHQQVRALELLKHVIKAAPMNLIQLQETVIKACQKIYPGEK